MNNLVRSRHLPNADPGDTMAQVTISSQAASGTPPNVEPTNVFDKPIVKYFTVTSVFALIALLALLVYYIISHIESKRALQADRKSYACIQMPPSGGRRMSRPMLNGDCETSNNRGRYAFPFIWKLARRN
ncbi:hypothetical protein LSH36_40g22007 [Paralvinella palmiformis]|uniref:Uncharacterized protein n=1 Tax=Paralvinella palmiformis TaxID=53620 RepID=A0AAD9K7T2_9ANNE|nr:hypothetical protein LSH36_40g22007 [Paralvinella palmiformis]